MSDERTREEQIEDIMDHYEDPRHYGPMKDATVSFKGLNPGCGDIITLYLKIDDEGKIIDVTFEGEGCTISQAAASMATEQVIGKTVKEVEAFPPDYMMDIVGQEVALSRPKCSTLGLNNVREAIRLYRRRQTLKDSGLSDEEINADDDGHACPSH